MCMCRARRRGAVVFHKLNPRCFCLLCAPSRDTSSAVAMSVSRGDLAFVTKKLCEENIVSVPLCGKRSRPRWIVPDDHPECRVFSLFLSHEPHQRPRHHQSDPGQLHHLICQSSSHSGGTVFGPTLVQHVLVSASSVCGLPRFCYPRNSQNPGGGRTNSWRDGFLLLG